MAKTAIVRVALADATTRLIELIARVLQGDEVIVSRAGTPLVRLAAIVPPDRLRATGLNAGDAWTSADFDAELPEEFWPGKA